MLLVIDAGNSNIVFGLMKGEEVAKTWRAETTGPVTKTTFTGHFDPAAIEGGILGSVVPKINAPLQKVFHDLTGKDLVIARAIDSGVTFKVDEPERVGIDRVMDALAGLHYFGPPLIIIDFGTATTFNALDKQGAFLGGAIAAGIGTTLKSLYREASQLPVIDFKETQTLIGRNTGEAMTSGAWFGALSLVEGMAARMKAEMGEGTRVAATGGYSTMFQGRTEAIDHFAPDLTLQGLRLLYQRMAG